MFGISEKNFFEKNRKKILIYTVIISILILGGGLYWIYNSHKEKSKITEGKIPIINKIYDINISPSNIRKPKGNECAGSSLSKILDLFFPDYILVYNINNNLKTEDLRIFTKNNIFYNNIKKINGLSFKRYRDEKGEHIKFCIPQHFSKKIIYIGGVEKKKFSNIHLTKNKNNY